MFQIEIYQVFARTSLTTFVKMANVSSLTWSVITNPTVKMDLMNLTAVSRFKFKLLILLPVNLQT